MSTLQNLIKPAANSANPYKFVPFTAFLRIEPVQGKRMERYFDMQKAAAYVETSLDDFCNSTEDKFLEFAKPIAFTPAFGNKPARLTIHGHACRRIGFTKYPTGEHTLDYDGTRLTGGGCGNSANRIPDPDLDTICMELKNGFENISINGLNLQALRIEVAGFIYGQGGLTFPA
jgi:hypothetical protein